MKAGQAFVDTIGLCAAVGGATAAMACALRRWRVEFIAISGLGGALLIYNIVDWGLLFAGGDRPVRGPAIVAAAFCLLVARGTGLYAFSLRTARFKKAAHRVGT